LVWPSGNLHIRSPGLGLQAIALDGAVGEAVEFPLWREQFYASKTKKSSLITAKHQSIISKVSNH
jgi:hypothetical protein